MTLELPAPDKTRLARSPLELVVCQIRYEQTLQASDSHTALAFHRDLGGSKGPYPNAEQFRGQTINVNLGQPAPVTESVNVSGWRFTAQDSTWVVSLMPDHVSLETAKYSDWDEFRERLGQLVDSTVEHLNPAFEQRIGLRYIDRITELGLNHPREWQPFVIPELFGLVGHPSIGDRVRATQQQLVLEIEDDILCSMRHGFIQDPGGDGAVDYLLDFDLGRQGGRPFDAQDIRNTADTLNEYALQLFQACITPDLLERLR